MGPGTVIANKYRLVRSLGEGAMGTVWEAVNLFTRRPFALKLVRQDAAAGAELMQRMLREASAAGQLQHPNVIEVYDFGTTETGEPFLVMELLTGQTLEALLELRTKLDVVRAAAIGVEVARALAVAHGAGIIHRDLKPANIFLHEELERSRVVKVLDFGVSKQLDADPGTATVTGVPIGTPAYMSPEQAQGAKSVDFRADVWALGVILFEMVTGRLPYQGATAYAIVGELLHGRIPRISELDPSIDPRFDEIVARCMERDVERRFGTAREVEVALESLLTKSTSAVLMDLDEDATLSRSAPAALAAATPALAAPVAGAEIGVPRVTLPSGPDGSGPHLALAATLSASSPDNSSASYPDLLGAAAADRFGPGSGSVQLARTQLAAPIPSDRRVTVLFAAAGGSVLLLLFVLVLAVAIRRPASEPEVLSSELPSPSASSEVQVAVPPPPVVPTASSSSGPAPSDAPAPSASAPPVKKPVFVRPQPCRGTTLIDPVTKKQRCVPSKR